VLGLFARTFASRFVEVPDSASDREMFTDQPRPIAVYFRHF